MAVRGTRRSSIARRYDTRARAMVRIRVRVGSELGCAPFVHNTSIRSPGQSVSSPGTPSVPRDVATVRLEMVRVRSLALSVGA